MRRLTYRQLTKAERLRERTLKQAQRAKGRGVQIVAMQRHLLLSKISDADIARYLVDE